MEIYIAPREEAALPTLARDQVLESLASAGVEVVGQDEEPHGGGGGFWVLRFRASDASLRFQDRSDGLGFATLDQSMFDDSGVPERICAALESLGWVVDSENVG